MMLPPSFRSSYDRQVHYIRDSAEGGVTEALCTHTVPTEELEFAEDDEGPRCYACFLQLGVEVSKRVGDADRWA